MSQDIPPAGNRTGHTDMLRAIEPGTNILVLDARVQNISALCSIIDKGGYRCRTEGKNVRVFRLKREEQ